MAKALEEVTKDAMALSTRERLALAGILLESTDAVEDADIAAAWHAEILERIHSVDNGREHGVAYEDVMREAASRLAS